MNPSDLNAKGAAIQASLIQEFDKEDIEQSTHPMVTVTPHIRNAIGVVLVSSDHNHGIFKPLIEAETAVPARRVAQFLVPKAGGDVLVKVCEGIRDIKITKPEPKSKANGNTSDEDASGVDSDEDDDVREKIWKIGTPLAEIGLKGIKPSGKIEVMVNVGGDLGVQITAREVGGKGGVRGVLESPKAVENGST
jgi:molecular chaperone DnaK (HSP70)